MKKLYILGLLAITFLFSFSFFEAKAITYEDVQLPTNLVSNPFTTKTWNDAFAQDYWLMYSNYNYYDDGLAVYFPSADENDDHLWYVISANPPTIYVYAGVEFYDSGYNMIDFISFQDTAEYVADVYGAWYAFETLEIGVTYFRVKMLYAGDSSYASDMQAQTLIAPLYAGQASTFMNWYLSQFEGVSEGYYNAGYNDAEELFTNGMYDNGSAFYGFDGLLSFDYLEGYNAGFIVGGARNVNAGITAFMEDFDKWIVIAILLVLLIGGSIATVRSRRRGE